MEPPLRPPPPAPVENVAACHACGFLKQKLAEEQEKIRELRHELQHVGGRDEGQSEEKMMILEMQREIASLRRSLSKKAAEEDKLRDKVSCYVFENVSCIRQIPRCLQKSWAFVTTRAYTYT